MADTLVDDFDLIEFLESLTRHTAEVSDAASAGLLLADPHGRLQYMASSSTSVKLLELFQLQYQEGPCLDCYAHRRRRGQQRPAPSRGAVAAVRTARGRGRVPVGARLPPAPPAEGDRGVEPVQRRPRPLRTDRRSHRPVPRRHRHHRAPPGAHHPRRRAAHGAAAGRPEQPDHHRAGQGRPGQDARHRRRRRVRPDAQLRPQPTTTASATWPARWSPTPVATRHSPTAS